MKSRIEQLITGLGVLLGTLIVTSCGDQAQHPRANSRERSMAIQCGVNLRTIDGAKTVWAQEHNKTTNDIPTDSDLFGPGRYISDRSTVTCLKGGTLTIGRLGEKPKCSIEGHTY